MSLKNLSVVLTLVLCAGATFAQPEKSKPARPSTPASQPGDKKPGDHAMPQGDMPAWMTPEMMKEMEACMKAAEPGSNHEYLQKMVGTWEGKNKMWMAPGAEPMETTSTAKFASTLGGRYIHGEFKGPMPGMGMDFEGACIYGYDNVSKKFQVCWVDNMGTGMMIGTGELSPDKKTLTWTMKWNHPTRGEITFREVDTMISPDEMKLEMYGPHTDGKEFKMMEIVSKRTSKEQPSPHGKDNKEKGASSSAKPHAKPTTTTASAGSDKK